MEDLCPAMSLVLDTTQTKLTLHGPGLLTWAPAQHTCPAVHK